MTFLQVHYQFSQILSSLPVYADDLVSSFVCCYPSFLFSWSLKTKTRLTACWSSKADFSCARFHNKEPKKKIDFFLYAFEDVDIGHSLLSAMYTVQIKEAVLAGRVRLWNYTSRK